MQSGVVFKGGRVTLIEEVQLQQQKQLANQGRRIKALETKLAEVYSLITALEEARRIEGKNERTA